MVIVKIINKVYFIQNYHFTSHKLVRITSYQRSFTPKKYFFDLINLLANLHETKRADRVKSVQRGPDLCSQSDIYRGFSVEKWDF